MKMIFDMVLDTITIILGVIGIAIGLTLAGIPGAVLIQTLQITLGQ